MNVIREKKAKDFTEAVFALMRERSMDKMEDIIAAAAAGPAPRFYVSFENARRFVSLIIRGKKIPLLNKKKMAMYEELAKKYIARRKQLREDGERYVNYVLLEEIIETPAPSFYADAETLRCLFYQYMRLKR